MASAPGDPTSLEDIDEEVTFYNVLMDSLDREAADYAERRTEHEAKIAHLHALAQQMLSNSSPQNQPSNQRNLNSDPFTGDNSGDGSRDPWWQAAMNGRPSSNQSDVSGITGNSYASSNLFDTPINGNKRLRAQSSYLDPYEHAAKRPTPDPSQAGTPASSSDSSNELTDRHALDQARRRHMAAEDAARRQREIQMADAAYARQLQDSNRASAASSQPSSRSLQTTLNYNGSYQRPPPIMKPEPSSSTPSRAYHQSAYGQSPAAAPQVKAEPISYPQQMVSRPRQQAQVVDLTGSDSEDDDITEVAPTSFRPNHRHPMPGTNDQGFNNTRSLHMPNATIMQMPTTLQSMPGEFPTSHQYNDQQVYGNTTSSMAGSNWLAQTMNSVRNAANSLGGPLQQLQDVVYGSNARPFDIDDDDDDDLIYGGQRRAPNFGNYTGNEDLYNSRYNQLAAYDSTKNHEEIQALLANIRPDEDMPAHLRVQSPPDLSCQLHKYQEMGLTWLKNCEEGSNKGGILADDMGLGKTIQMLALMVSRKSQDPRCKTTLIVAPVALMRQWAQEIRSKVKPGSAQLSVFTHHGSKKAKDFNELRVYDVVLTTYGSISSELKKLEAFRLRQLRDSSARPYPKEKCVFLDPSAEWYRVILDEAQCIKNRNTQAAKGACLLKAKFRFCVTGTPMMNNVEEFYSLIHFLRIKPYCQWEKFRIDINIPLRSAHEDTKGKAMQMLQALCKAVMLRRTKKSYFEGKPILVLPERTTTIDNPVFSNDEQDFYKALESQSQLQFNKYLRRGEVGTSYSAILVLLLRLRQACCHPHLIKDFGVSAASGLEEDQMVEFAKQLAEPVVARIKATGGNFECPVCYDVTPNPAIFIPCGHDTCSECFARIADPANAIQNGEEVGGTRCPNCRGQIDAKRLTDFNSFKKVHMPELLTEAERQGEDADENDDNDDDGSDDDDDDDSSSESEAEEGEEDGDETLGGFIVPDGLDEEPEERDEADDDDLDKPFKAKEEVKHEEGVAGPSNLAQIPEAQESKQGKGKAKASKKKKKSKGKKKAKKVKSTLTLAELKRLASRNKEHKKAYLRRLRKNYVGSAKIEKTMEILDGIMAADEGEKVIIFSQWTSLLDLLEIPIDGKSWGYRRYDGSMSASMRGDAVDDFRDERKDVRIMLISLKAGNAGLNLNMASQVIILDPFWNPYIEEQAIDRAHRFGQKRAVQVHRVLIEETVEDRIIALQEKKRALISQALDEKQASQLARLGVQELAYLFGVTHDPAARVNYQPRNQR